MAAIRLYWKPWVIFDQWSLDEIRPTPLFCFVRTFPKIVYFQSRLILFWLIWTNLFVLCHYTKVYLSVLLHCHFKLKINSRYRAIAKMIFHLHVYSMQYLSLFHEYINQSKVMLAQGFVGVPSRRCYTISIGNQTEKGRQNKITLECSDFTFRFQSFKRH